MEGLLCFLLVFLHHEISVGLKHESVRSSMKTSQIIGDCHNRNLYLNVSLNLKQTDFYFCVPKCSFAAIACSFTCPPLKALPDYFTFAALRTDAVIPLYREAGLKP